MGNCNLDERLDTELLTKISLAEGKNLHSRLTNVLKDMASRDWSLYVADRHALQLYSDNTAHSYFPEILPSDNIGKKSFKVLEQYLFERGIIEDTPYTDYISTRKQERSQKKLKNADRVQRPDILD